MLADSVTAQAPGETVWRFGSFVLWEEQRRLERRGQVVRLGSRSFGLLLQLLKRAGEVISNQEFLAAVWSGVVVDEASVRVHMSILRKALGAPEPQDACREWISNVPLRGYRFVGRVQRQFADGGAQDTAQWTIQCLPGQDVVLLMANGGLAIEPLSALLAQLLACIQSRAVVQHTVHMTTPGDWAGLSGDVPSRTH